MSYIKMIEHLKESLKFKGDIIEFGVYEGDSLTEIVKNSPKDKNIWGVDSFQGLEYPTTLDLDQYKKYSEPQGKYKAEYEEVVSLFERNENVNIVRGVIPNVLTTLPTEKLYCFAHIDLTHYNPTKESLDYIWDKMSYGGTIYFSNYNSSIKGLEHLAITTFLEQKKFNIIQGKQMFVNGQYEKCMAIKCLNPKNKFKNKTVNNRKVDDLIFACVLKKGGIYNAEYANRLIRGIKSNIDKDFKVYCLSDEDPSKLCADKVIPFKHGFPKWWSKLELFRSDIFEGKHVFYIDMDSIVLNNLEYMTTYDGDFMMLRDFYHPQKMASGVMMWKDGRHMHRMYEKFLADPVRYMQLFHGDQDFISFCEPTPDFFQDIFPRKTISYKVHCLKNHLANVPVLPEEATVLCFHGNPRMHEINNKISDIWKKYDNLVDKNC